MAEFCLECWNKLNEVNDTPRRYVISREYDLCEGCGEYKQVIIKERLWSMLQKNFIEYISLFQKNKA